VQGRRATTKRGETAEDTGAPPPPDALPGVVTRAYGKFFDVRLDGRQRSLLCTTRGALRRHRLRTDLVAVGDRVWVTDVGEGEGQIEAIAPRTRVLARLARKTEDIEQVVLANPDQALFLFSWREPEPHTRMLDRFLVLAESRGLPAMIGINKVDLDPDGHATIRTFFRDYPALYPTLLISTRTGEGLAELRDLLAGKITVVAGPSGAGKSSLLNALDPGMQRLVGAISEATGKGRHTTTATVLYEIDPGTFVADTPGIRALALHGVEDADLPACFPEMRPYLGQCFYADCRHVSEPGCAVLAALAAGTISRTRYESYRALLERDAATD